MLSLYFHDAGNIIFEIKVSPHSESTNVRQVGPNNCIFMHIKVKSRGLSGTFLCLLIYLLGCLKTTFLYNMFVKKTKYLI